MREIILINITGQDKPGLTSSLTNILAQYASVLAPTTKEHVLELERAQQLNERFEKLKRWLNEEGVEYSDLLLN